MSLDVRTCPLSARGHRATRCLRSRRAASPARFNRLARPSACATRVGTTCALSRACHCFCPEVTMRGTESQDRVVATPNTRRAFLRRYGVMIGIGAALLLFVVWSARAWLSSEKVIPRDRLRTAVVERGPFVRDVAATGTWLPPSAPPCSPKRPAPSSIRCAPATRSRPATCWARSKAPPSPMNMNASAPRSSAPRPRSIARPSKSGARF